MPGQSHGDDEKQLPWTDSADVVVVGGGGAGMAAALSAAETDSDQDVLVLQKLGELGGSTTMSIGSISAADTYLQERAGIDDSAEEHFQDMEKFVDKYTRRSRDGYYLDFQGDVKSRDDLALKRRIADRGSETVAWLHDHGCEYDGPYAEPPNRVPRMYVLQPDSSAYAEVLSDALRDAGVRVAYDSTAYELVESDGTVRGVLAEQDGRSNPMVVKADRGVILTTGGYINDQELRAAYTTNADAPPINEHNSGDGHTMAEAVGADLVNMDVQGLTMRFGDPLYTAPRIGALVDDGAILVDRNGDRYLNETIHYDQIFTGTLRRPGGVLYLLFDQETAAGYTEWPEYISTFPGSAYAYLEDYLETEVLTRTESVATLAKRADMDQLDTTVEEYNAAAAGRRVDKYGRIESLEPLDNPPFYLLGPVHPYSVVTEGGVAVDTDLRVLDSNGAPIDGLYAAGETAGGALWSGHGHHHLFVFTSGRIAGRTVVRDAGT